jgi:WD40 repeat protein
MTTVAPVVIDEQNPWPGLGAFDEAAERFFNGRSQETAELRRLVVHAPLTVLFGASGLGKTSLVQAGLFPLLRKDRVLPVYVRLDARERAVPLIDQVRHALQVEIRARHVDAPPFRAEESLWQYLHRTGLELWSEHNQLLTPLFAFDQFEEVFTLGVDNPAAIAQLRLDLADLIENRMPASLAAQIQDDEAAGAGLSLDSQRYRVLLSFREDFLPAVESWKRELPSLLRNRLRLLPMSGEQAFEAVHRTAPHLTDESMARQIVLFVAAAQEERSVGSPEAGASLSDLSVEPALLSLLCHGLNEKRRAVGKSTFDEALLKGTGQAIIGDYYQGAVKDLSTRVRRFIERELITERGFRKPYDVDDARSVQGVSDRDLRLLVDRRLLRIEPHRGSERVELTHDLLTRVVREHRDRQRERDRVRRQRLRAVLAGIIGVVLAGLVVMFGSLYRSAEREKDEKEDALQKAEREKDEKEDALQKAEREKGRAEDAQGRAEDALAAEQKASALAEHEARLSLSHRLAVAALNASDESARLLFALRAIAVTRSADGIVLPNAEDALRQVAPALPQKLARPGHTSPITRIDFSPDGSRVATSGQDGVRIWNTSSGEEVLLLSPRGCAIMEFSPDWRQLACASGIAGEVWDVEAGKIAWSVFNYEVTGSRGSNITQFKFAPDGKLLAGDTGAARLSADWSVHGSPAKTFLGDGAVFSPDGRHLASIVEEGVTIWDVGSGAELRTLELGGPIQVVAFSPDGSKLAIGGKGMDLWEESSDKQLRTVAPKGDSDFRCIAFSPDGSRLAGCSSAGPCKIWNVSSGREEADLSSRESNLGPEVQWIRGNCYFTSDGSRLIARAEREGDDTYVWNLRAPDSAEAAPTTLIARAAGGSAVAFSRNGKYLATADGSSARVEELASGTAVSTLLARADRLYAVAFSPDRQVVVTAGSDHQVRVWDVASGRRLKTLTGPQREITGLAYSPDGTLIAAAGDNPVAKLWDAGSGRFLRDLVGHQSWTRILGVAFSPDGKRVATAGYDYTARIWNATTGEDLTAASPIRGEGSIFLVAFSHDGKRLATAGLRGASVWDATSFQKLFDVPGNITVDFGGLAFSTDGRLAVASQNRVRIWQSRSDWTTLSGVGFSGLRSLGIAFTRDGKQLAAAGTGGTVGLWDTSSGDNLRSFYGHKSPIGAVALSPDETQLYAIGNDWAVYRHPLRLDDLIAVARKRVARPLTDEDCLKYLHQTPCPAEVRPPSPAASSTGR